MTLKSEQSLPLLLSLRDDALDRTKPKSRQREEPPSGLFAHAYDLVKTGSVSAPFYSSHRISRKRSLISNEAYEEVTRRNGPPQATQNKDERMVEAGGAGKFTGIENAELADCKKWKKR
jgi:hypothetical protein